MSHYRNRYGKLTEAQAKAGTGEGRSQAACFGRHRRLQGRTGQTIKRAYPLDTSDMELPGERLERPDFGAGESLPRT